MPTFSPNSKEETRYASYEGALREWSEQGQYRRCIVVEPDGFCNVKIGSHSAVHFSSNDYLSLSKDSRLNQSAIEAVHRYGVGTASSRLIAGTNDLVVQLEEAVAAWKNTEAALVFSSGYQANVAILQAILKPEDWVLGDKLNHASLVDGCRLSGAVFRRYRHLDFNHLESLLQKAPSTVRKWIVTDSVFSMDGDYPDLRVLADLAERYDALIMVDEAHAAGLYGKERSSGLCEHFDVSQKIALQMGTFSKALGGMGAYVAGSTTLIQYLVNAARGFIYSTAPPPASIAAALRAIEIVQEDPVPKQRLWENIAYFQQQAQKVGQEIENSIQLDLPQQSPIVPIVIGDTSQTMAMSHDLLGEGFYIHGVRPPTVKPGSSRLRLTLNAQHTHKQIGECIHALQRLWAINEWDG